MEPKKRWDGYVSFSYLEPGVDYKEFELSPQIGRVEPFVYPLTDEQNERADRLLRDCDASRSTTTAASPRWT